MAGHKQDAHLFEGYEQEYQAISLAITNKINTLIPSQVSEQRNATIRATEREIEEAEEIVGQMELTLGRYTSPLKEQLNGRLRASKADLAKLKRDMKKVMAKSNDRANLLGQAGAHDSANADATHLDHRQRLLSGTDRLQQSTRRLEEGHRLALETEALGASILGDLRAQREQIQHTRDTLHEADSYVDKAQRTLRGMARR
ncbi:snare region anchored in the vesicle membrane C-terminus-domain-containing protein [Syncephalis pseudoplumigaleata]|uniref:Snare region anchored in the vesicle membrane C-terminus-domain-containing protein n=1 Tax=Syncephalis pseudoplumigaleata TaxID=1712513 RepID=A0A4P9Z012_9FUNG|nr:snare region anchored in the vesicle membrane C-terminus-domain-containing protein [Syncephalis pseudoplumigaleata]|eukprot:RKP25736.1 snare region anchored in the vesicle membrane C-terminus-domain-containing protein [Syncephalis pseudoplumigaleata]